MGDRIESLLEIEVDRIHWVSVLYGLGPYFKSGEQLCNARPPGNETKLLVAEYFFTDMWVTIASRMIASNNLQMIEVRLIGR